MPVTFFFDEMSPSTRGGRAVRGRGRKKGANEATSLAKQVKDPLIKGETLQLVRAYYKIREAETRTCVRSMIMAVSAAGNSAGTAKGKKR